MKLDINIVVPLCVLLTCLGFSAGYTLKTEKINIEKENQCIKELIQSGVERKHIFTSEGKCYLESPL